MMKKGRFLWAAALLLAAGLTASAATVNVAPGQSIQAAIDGASPGDTIALDAGTFTQNFDITKAVDIVGAGSGATILTQTTAGAGDTKIGVIQISASGASAADPIRIAELRIEPVGMAAISVGRFTEATGTSVANISLENVHVVGTNTNPSTEQERGLYVDLTSSLTGLSVADCAFDNLTYGWYFQKDVSADASNVSDVNVVNTTFNHNNHKGLYAEKLSAAVFTGCTFDNNGYDASVLPSYFQPWSCGVDVNLKAGSYSDISFYACTITDNGIGGAKEGAGLTVKARDDGASYGAFPASLDGVVIAGCLVTGNERGIRIGEPGKGNLSPTNVTISGCDVYGNVQQYLGSDGSAYGGLINASVAALSATDIWWGDASGPAGDGPGIGDAVVADPGAITYVPFATASTLSGQAVWKVATVHGYDQFDISADGSTLTYHPQVRNTQQWYWLQNNGASDPEELAVSGKQLPDGYRDGSRTFAVSDVAAGQRLRDIKLSFEYNTTLGGYTTINFFITDGAGHYGIFAPTSKGLGSVAQITVIDASWSRVDIDLTDPSISDGAEVAIYEHNGFVNVYGDPFTTMTWGDIKNYRIAGMFDYQRSPAYGWSSWGSMFSPINQAGDATVVNGYGLALIWGDTVGNTAYATNFRQIRNADVTLLGPATYDGAFESAQLYSDLPIEDAFDPPSPQLQPEDVADGGWYVDRYAPAGFASGLCGSDNALIHDIAAADYKGYGNFYNTQGRKLDTWTASLVEIKVAIGADWLDENRYAGFWGTTFTDHGQTTGSVYGYPILAYTNYDGSLGGDAVAGQFRFYTQDTDQDESNDLQPGYVTLRELTAADVGQVFTLRMEIVRDAAYLYGTAYKVQVLDGSGAIFAEFVDEITWGATQFGNVILQGYNYNEDYSICWDDFRAAHWNILSLNPTPASIYIQPGESILVDMDIASLSTPVIGCQAMLGYSSTYFEDPGAASVSPGGGVWDTVEWNSWRDATGVPGEIDTVIWTSSTYGGLGNPTSEDATIAKIELTARAGVEGVTSMVFRPDVNDGERTFLSDADIQDVIPFKLDSAAIFIDGTAPVLTNLAALESGVDVLDGANATVQGTVSITVDAIDAFTGLVGVPTISVIGPETLAATLIDGDGPAFGWTVEVLSTTANGSYDIVITAEDMAGNTSTISGTLEVNKNQVTGLVELQSLAGDLVREVTFVADGGVKSWTVPVSFPAGSAIGSYTLTDVPGGVTSLSAKTAWNLRVKLEGLTADGDGQITADFVDADKLRGGDINGSNSVNILDFAILKRDYGTALPQADINGSGDVNIADFVTLKQNWFTVGDDE